MTSDMANRDSVPGLPAKLKAAREAALLSQQQAAERSGVHVVSISRFETDERTPTLATLLKLADAYRVDVCELLPSKGSPDAGEDDPLASGTKPAPKKPKGSKK